MACMPIPLLDFPGPAIWQRLRVFFCAPLHCWSPKVSCNKFYCRHCQPMTCFLVHCTQGKLTFFYGRHNTETALFLCVSVAPVNAYLFLAFAPSSGHKSRSLYSDTVPLPPAMVHSSAAEHVFWSLPDPLQRPSPPC